eukprot:m.56340 g.56340  ORF g.56340 m.56340 type:complete len:57 (-) comp11187_c0_seq4:1152-1322(-)
MMTMLMSVMVVPVKFTMTSCLLLAVLLTNHIVVAFDASYFDHPLQVPTFQCMHIDQ